MNKNNQKGLVGIIVVVVVLGLLVVAYVFLRGSIAEKEIDQMDKTINAGQDAINKANDLKDKVNNQQTSQDQNQ
ncbi:MAG: hypothetical protein UT18_C0001G0002 [candidate division CPR2 bacterium GW2011_GWC2_39_10]|uniref:Uncharacterized protein n=1 Tax=candidate division CPR2 bacterium GW2011_GWC2_39_10 TaxID=1618345 RepID=A0A0G0M506_UNCC2|nr:MAG: hypothetical protein UT18_C0001G0002 [candidate division CPR2 bacterium GW2011_GWC2_39_10]